MRRHADGTLTYSPSDLVRFHGSPFATWMDRFALERPGVATPDEATDQDRLVIDLGLRHEARYLGTLRTAGRDVIAIAQGRDADTATRAALAAGPTIVYQAALACAPFAGFADFLERVEGASALGAFHYEVTDTKVAGDAKPGYLLQLCAYAEMLEAVQGRRPEQVHLVLRGDQRRSFRTDDFFFVYRTVKEAFLAQMAAFHPDQPPEPDLGGNWGRWDGEARRRLEAADHLALVAGMRGDQVKKLRATGIATVAALAARPPARVKGMGPDVVTRLHHQARLQLASRGKALPVYEVVTPAAGAPPAGLASLPPASPLDVYFDLEGYPLVEGGLEYLFGAATEGRDEADFVDWWAHDDVEERRALEAFVAFVEDRRRRDPTMHVYHYAPYEKTALRKLMGRYGVCEDAVDGWLRAGVLVDLYGVVRQGLRVGTPSYSIKALEVLWGRGRAGAVQTGGDSIVAYHRFLESGEPRDWRASALLAGIRAYNREDCLSTRELAHWLRARQREHKIAWRAPDEAADAEPSTQAQEASARRAAMRALADDLLRSVPADAAARAADPDRWRVTELLAHLVEFHRREDKPVWWSLFDRLDADDADRVEDPTCLAGLVRETGPTIAIKRSKGAWYRFDPAQETKIAEGSGCVVAVPGTPACSVETLDLDGGRVLVKFGPKALAALGGEPPATTTLLLHEMVGAKPIEDSLVRTATAWRDGTPLPRALDDLLLRRAPRVRGHRGGPLVRPGEDPTAATARLALALQGSVLAVQGPPGTGKTYTGARAIAALVAAGRRVGVTSNSHKAILNLLAECARAIPGFRCLKVGAAGNEDDAAFEASTEGVTLLDAAGAAATLDAHLLVGATAWFFSREDVAGQFDTLFVDEAGQVSLANLVGMAPSAENVVLLGDPAQLAQPIQGTHPGDSAMSALDFALYPHPTVPEDRGVFLPVTRRLHPRLTAFVSGAFYEGRLTSAPGTERRVVRAPSSTAKAVATVPLEAGILWVPVPHEGTPQQSEEEATAVAALVGALVGRAVTGLDGKPEGRLGLADVLVVAPYNLQVRTLKAALPAGVRVGSVDRFQGQEARVAIVSLTASDAEGATRGLEFVLDPHRTNVAISRAMSLAIVVGSPSLTRARCASVDALRLVNTLCRVVAEGTARA